MKTYILGDGELVMLVPEHTKEEYPKQTVPVVILKHQSDKYNSWIEEIYKGDKHGGNVVLKTRCVTVGYLAMAIRDRKYLGNLINWMTRAVESRQKDGFASEVEWIKGSGSGGKLGHRFSPDGAKIIQNICRRFLKLVDMTDIPDEQFTRCGFGRLITEITTLAEAPLRETKK